MKLHLPNNIMLIIYNIAKQLGFVKYILFIFLINCVYTDNAKNKVKNKSFNILLIAFNFNKISIVGICYILEYLWKKKTFILIYPKN